MIRLCTLYIAHRQYQGRRHQRFVGTIKYYALYPTIPVAQRFSRQETPTAGNPVRMSQKIHLPRVKGAHEVYKFQPDEASGGYDVLVHPVLYDHYLVESLTQ